MRTFTSIVVALAASMGAAAWAQVNVPGAVPPGLAAPTLPGGSANAGTNSMLPPPSPAASSYVPSSTNLPAASPTTPGSPLSPPETPNTLGGVTVQPNPNPTVGGLPTSTP